MTVHVRDTASIGHAQRGSSRRGHPPCVPQHAGAAERSTALLCDRRGRRARGYTSLACLLLALLCCLILTNRWYGSCLSQVTQGGKFILFGILSFALLIMGCATPRYLALRDIYFS